MLYPYSCFCPKCGRPRGAGNGGCCGGYARRGARKKTTKKMKGKDDVGCGDAPPAGLRSPVFKVALENASDEMEKYEVLGMKLRVERWGVDTLH